MHRGLRTRFCAPAVHVAAATAAAAALHAVLLRRRRLPTVDAIRGRRGGWFRRQHAEARLDRRGDALLHVRTADTASILPLLTQQHQ